MKRCAPFPTFFRLSSASALVLSFLFIMLMNVSGVEAHSRLESSTPSAGSILPSVPPTVSMTFTEAFDPSYSSASLVASTGETVSAITLTVDPQNEQTALLAIASPDQPPGVYTIVWRVLSAVDGHATTGTLSFSAGTGSAPTISDVAGKEHSPWLTTIGRWLDLTGMMAIAGACAFMLIVTFGRPLKPVISSTAFGLRWISIGAGIAGVAGLAISTVGLAISATGRSWSDPPPFSVWTDTLRHTSPGKALIVRTAMLALTIVLALIWARRPARPIIIAATITGLVGLATFSFSGHAAAESNPNLKIAIDLAHISGGAIWGGGLLVLGLALVRLLRSPEDDDSRQSATTLILKSTTINLIAMLIIVGAGVVASASRVSGPQNLTGTSYGQALIVKVLLVILVLVIAGVNRLFIVPRIRKANRERNQIIEDGQTRRIRVTVAMEIGFALLILFAAARMTEIAPANGPLTVDVAPRTGEIHTVSTSGDIAITLTGLLDPAAAETMSINVTDAASGKPVTDLARVIVLATASNPLDPSGAQLRDRFDATPFKGRPGLYTIPRARLGFDAVWNLEISARRLGVEDASVTIPVDLTGTGPQSPRLVDDSWQFPRLPITGWLALVAAVATFAGGIVLVKRLKGLEPVTGGIFLVVIVAITGAFFLTAYRSGPLQTSSAGASNPLNAADPAIVQRGEVLFAEQCMSCHGIDGRGADMSATMGHGESGGSADLTSGAARERTDGDLYGVISDGLGGTEMPAYDIALTEDQRWELVTHIRQLQDEAKNAPVQP
jgi:copper transport protein